MMNLTEIKKMLQKDFNVKYLSDLEQIELVQNNEDLHIGIVKVELKVAYKYYTIGTFGVLNKNAKVDGRKVKASMTYLNKIASWLVEKQEVEVKIFKDSDLQEIKKVKMVELLTTQEPTQAIEKVACEVQESQAFITDSIQDLYAQKIYLLKKQGELIKAIKEGRNKGLSNKSDEIKKLREEKDLLSNQCNAITDELVKRGAIIKFNDEQQPTTKESCKTVEPQTIKEETQEQPTFEEKREYQKTHMELIYNIITNNVKGFNKEYKNRAITRLYKYTDDMYTARFTLSYFYHDEKEKWMFTLKNHDGILLNYNIHKSLLDEKWLLDLCKEVNKIINESK